MPCVGPGGAYFRLWHALLPISWSATEVSMIVFLATYFAGANVCKPAKWHAGNESRGGWYQLCSVVWRFRFQTSSRIRDILAEMFRDSPYSRKPMPMTSCKPPTTYLPHILR